MKLSSQHITYLLSHVLVLQLLQFGSTFSPVPCHHLRVATKPQIPSFVSLLPNENKLRHFHNVQKDVKEKFHGMMNLDSHKNGKSNDGFNPVFSLRKKWRKRRVVVASLISLFGSRFLATTPPAYALRSPDQEPITNAEAQIGSTKRFNKASVALKGAVGVLVVGGLILKQTSRKESTVSVGDKKIEFEEIIGYNDKPNNDLIVQKYDEIGVAIPAEDEVKDTTESPPEEESGKTEQEIAEKTRAKAAAVTQTIHEATERAKKEEKAALEKDKVEEEVLSKSNDEDDNSEIVLDNTIETLKSHDVSTFESEDILSVKEGEEVQELNLEELSNIGDESTEKILDDTDGFVESDDISNEEMSSSTFIEENEEGERVNLEDEILDVVKIENDVQTEEEKKQMTMEMLNEIEDPGERAFHILLDLGMVTRSRDPDSKDYDHSDDHEFVK